MAAVLTLDDVRKAWDARDPRLIHLIEQLCQQPTPKPETPIRKGALTFEGFLSSLRDWNYRHKTREEQAHYRIETLKALESPTAEVPLADKFKVHEVIFTLWQSDDALARDYLLRIIASVPLVYGPWKALKRIFKEAEAKNDTEVFGAIAARIDMASAQGHGREVSGATPWPTALGELGVTSVALPCSCRIDLCGCRQRLPHIQLSGLKHQLAEQYLDI